MDAAPAGSGGDGAPSAMSGSSNGMDGPMSVGPICGNSVIESGEKCDPSSTCPTLASCQASDKCLGAMLRGDAALCNVECVLVMISECNAGDGCCPSGCTSATDTDCSATCGDGVIASGETCEPTSTSTPCPETCDDQDACTEDITTGTPAQCNVACTNKRIAQPTDDDECCPSGANANNDSDCTAACGNRILEPGETCDGDCPDASCDDGDPCTKDLSTGAADTCTAACTHSPITGPASGDRCCPSGASANNDSDCDPKCGNGTKEDGETCDGASCQMECDDGDDCTTDRRTGSASSCNVACENRRIAPCCGNGITEIGETCDGATCTMRCNDGDDCTRDGTTGNASTCDVRCTREAIVPCCGNDRVEPPETCDGNCDSVRASCNDNNACTEDPVVGRADQCNVSCGPKVNIGTGTPNACRGCSALPQALNSECWPPTGPRGECRQAGVTYCDGTDALRCVNEVAGEPEVCGNLFDDNCNDSLDGCMEW